MVRRPAFLQTAGLARSISMDNIVEVTAVGTFRCPEAIKNRHKDISFFHDRVAWSLEKHNALNEAISVEIEATRGRCVRIASGL